MIWEILSIICIVRINYSRFERQLITSHHLQQDMCYYSALLEGYEDICLDSASILESSEDVGLFGAYNGYRNINADSSQSYLKRVRIQLGDCVLEPFCSPTCVHLLMAIQVQDLDLPILVAQTVPDCTTDAITFSTYQTTSRKEKNCRN